MIERVKKIFLEKHSDLPSVIVRSPGRVNIIGEHTDYNEGFVLPAAIDKAAYVAASLRDDDEIHLTAADLNKSFKINIRDLQPQRQSSWPNFMMGPAAQFAKRDLLNRGFNAVLTSNVPIGAGLSSSAAVEAATVFVLNELFQTHISKIEMIKMAQQAEHEYAGVLCGIMDMFASVMGKKDQLIKLDCRTLEYQYIPFDLTGIRILLLNTNVKHSLASSEYNTRRRECGQAVQWISEIHPEIKSLRDVTAIMLDNYVLPKDTTIDKRGRFVVEEIERLTNACADLEKGNLEGLGKKMFATHDGLSKIYEVSCKELDFLVDFVRNRPEVIGARMMGGGFGGCTINLVKEEAIPGLIEAVKPVYEKEMNKPLTYYVASVENGTEAVS